MSDWDWSIDGSHKWSTNSNWHAFFGWNVTKIVLFVWWMLTVIYIALCIFLPHLLLFPSSLFLNNIFIWILLDNSFIFPRKCGWSLKSLTLCSPNKILGHIHNIDKISHDYLLFLDTLHHYWEYSHWFDLKWSLLCVINDYLIVYTNNDL